VKINSRTIILADANIQVSDVVTCLGVAIDSQLTFVDSVKKLSGSSFYHLRQLHSVCCSLTASAANTLVYALISSRVDCCSSVLYGVCEVHLRQLQLVLNAAAWLITGKRKFDHIASTMRDDLHWLPVQQRIQFKLCTLVSKCLRHTAPSYLTDMCIQMSAASGHSCLWSCSHHNLYVPRCRLTWYGPWGFSMSGPTAWNSLLTSIRDLSESSFLSTAEDWTIP